MTNVVVSSLKPKMLQISSAPTIGNIDVGSSPEWYKNKCDSFFVYCCGSSPHICVRNVLFYVVPFRNSSVLFVFTIMKIALHPENAFLAREHTRETVYTFLFLVLILVVVAAVENISPKSPPPTSTSTPKAGRTYLVLDRGFCCSYQIRLRFSP